jgi:hypothetical protein
VTHELQLAIIFLFFEKKKKPCALIDPELGESIGNIFFKGNTEKSRSVHCSTAYKLEPRAMRRK